MHRRYRASFETLTRTLREIESSPFDNGKSLLAFQHKLAARIKRVERRLRALKNERKRLVAERRGGRMAAASSRVLRGRIQRIDDGIDDAKHLQFIWRCFGDALAFAYIDTWAMKHMFYSTDDYGEKQSPGALSGNTGSKREWQVLRRLQREGIPAVLSDLTNTIRHGDVCVLVGPDPFPIEVKSSLNRNARTARQIANLIALHDFLKNDHAENFRGLPRITRVEMPLPLMHIEAINECVERGRQCGIASVSPEPGLVYLCARAGEPPPLDTLGFGPKHMVGCLNEAVQARNWMPYRPFTLSIRDPASLSDFISGRLLVLVFVDTESVVASFRDRGFKATFVDHPQFELTLVRQGAGVEENVPWSAVSSSVFRRVFLEFASLSGIIDLAIHHLQDLETRPTEPIAEGHVPAMPASGDVESWPPKFKPRFDR